MALRPTEDPKLTSADTVASNPGSGIQPRLPVSSGTHEDEGRFVPGTLLNGRYRIGNLLGRGGMGEVYRATDLTLGQSVALKFLPESASGNVRFLERFHGEVRVARQVSHPNVCRVHDIGQVDGAPFISMEYVDGEDLAALLQRIGKLPFDKCVEIARKVCAGLAAAHSKGVIHRDLKPHNIMLNKRGEVVIMDFGLAAMAESLSGAEARNGTPAYMAPEQLKGFEVTAKSDIFALGVVLYELFTGKRPYPAETVQAMIDQQEAMQIAEGEDLNEAVLQVVRRCLHPDPAKRPVSPLAVSAALPGGDALAMALAAGETPSPEMVAAANGGGGLPKQWAIACLGTVLACAIGLPFLNVHRLAMMQAPMLVSPPVLEAKARDAARSFGFSEEPADRHSTLYNRGTYVSWVRRMGGGQRTPAQWMRGEPGMALQYRQSPVPLEAAPMGYVTGSNPAAMLPGMAEVQINTDGWLRGFSGVPTRSMDMLPGEGGEIVPDAVFAAAGFDFQKFQEIAPVSVPETAAARLRAWRGPHPAFPDVVVTVEVGWWKSQITWVNMRFPWTGQASGPDGEQQAAAALRTIRSILIVVIVVICGGFSLLLASRNWRLGRVDKRGAARLALIQFLLNAAAWAMFVHPVPNATMLDFLLNAIGSWLFPAAVLWVLYLALEPEVRARWPQSIVSWNRLLSTGFHDPLVASHFLVGSTLAALLWTLISLVLAADAGLDLRSVHPLNGTRAWLGNFPDTISNGIRISLIGFFALFLLRRLLRRDWIAAVAAALLFATLEGNVANADNWLFRYAIYACLHTALIFIVLRVGVVTAASWIVFVNLWGDTLLGTDWNSWYMPYGLASLAVLVGSACYAFWKSLGSRDLIEDDPALDSRAISQTSYPRS